MKTETPRPVRLKNYRPSPYLIDAVSLDFRLSPEMTLITARLDIRRNPKSRARNKALVLDGENIELRGLALDRATLAGGDYEVSETALTIHAPPEGPFTLTIETACNPAANTALSGLYRSNDTYCTQCEAEGFRRMTYYLDRPDVMAVFTTRIEAGKGDAPVLLANGNPVDAGPVEGTERHYAVWHDPWPKPAYLFALVAGDLAMVEDSFTTASGREVALRIYVEHGNEDRCGYAMDALKRSMRWDEEVFGREYDLDVFMIVAVSNFNMGAMENKGLNIFNDKYILARPDTATDADYAHIEAVIAHEYFHNWTGNRITCRDWFQLCLKEGLTVFRDQEFSSDMRSRPVKRIGDVRLLRSHQFPEDGGPLAHPVRPGSYIEINNFYTATVYEKGAEVIRMLKALIGEAAFARGMDLYFERHDGEAATVEQFVAAMADASGRDLTQFMLWYTQAGTPQVVVSGSHDAAAKTYTLEIAQTCAPTPGQAKKLPFEIPLSLALIGPNGGELPLTVEGGKPLDDRTVIIDDAKARFVFENIATAPVMSLNRGFSAPVTVVSNQTPDDLLFLMAHDSDPFNRWDAGQTYATGILKDMVTAIREDRDPGDDRGLARAFAACLEDRSLDPAFLAQMIQVPSEQDLAREIATDVDPGAIHMAREHLRRELGERLQDTFASIHATLADHRPYSPDAAAAGRRALRNAALGYLAAGAPDDGARRAYNQFEGADNMTDTIGALLVLSHLRGPKSEDALERFYVLWKNDHLVIDKWLALQASAPFEDTLDTVEALMRHPSFNLTNPNKVRALIGSFASANPFAFNKPDGSGYRFLADIVIALDDKNPQVAARMANAFRSWRMLEKNRRSLCEAELRRVDAAAGLSRDTKEIASRLLA